MAPQKCSSARAASVPLSTPQPTCATARRPPLERLLDRQLQSVSTFVSSEGSLLQQGMGRQGGQAGASRRSASAGPVDDGPPPVILFPANKPSSRADAVILDRWVTQALESYARRSQAQGTEDLSRAVDELVPVLSIGLHEVVRQVTHHCLERSVVLEKIWRTYVELFERALNETKASLRRHKDRTGKVEAQLARTRQELSELQSRHPEQIEKLSKTLAGKFAQRQEELEDKLKHFRQENGALQQHLLAQSGSLRSWFPLFEQYKDSSLRDVLMAEPAVLPSSVAPEAGIAADFQRIVCAMEPDRRRRVGFFVSSLLGLRTGQAQVGSDTVEGLTERRDVNKKRLSELELRLRELEMEMSASKPRPPESASEAKP